tara:strand:- start:7672 stop:8367 length:696 start_codon:yes stop_codon:yes gene_type:complete
MNKAFITDDLFEISKKIDPQWDGHTITIDNFYENAEDIYEWLENQQYPLWKYNPDRETQKNGVEYNDCRLVSRIPHITRRFTQKMDMIYDICRQYFWKGDYDLHDNVYEFNCFQTLKHFDSTLQHFPHIDSKLDTPNELSTLNMIVYLDKEESGGTACYHGEWIKNDESRNLLYPVKDIFELERIIPAKFNRCVIFAGNRIHGAWIDDYNKYSEESGKWRYNHVNFLIPQQ